MAELSETELKQIARDVAQRVGAGTPAEIEVWGDDDWAGYPSWYFSFLIDPLSSDPQERAAVRTGLTLGLVDELHARGDERFPYVITLRNRSEWDQYPRG